MNLTPIIVKRVLALEDLAGRTLAVDAFGEIYQFLALIRLRDGTPLRDSQGNVTSHLAGLFYRVTRLTGEYGLRLLFVFDGVHPELKSGEIARRKAIRERYAGEYREALEAGDLARAYSKSTMTSRLIPQMIADAERLLRLLGVPVVQAPGEAEAQAAFLAARGDAWAVGSKDYDSVLFGAPRLVRFLTLTGREFYPSTGASRPLQPELIDRAELLAALGLGPEELVDAAILIGTDFNAGVKGIGPKTALKLIRQHRRIEELPPEIRARVAPHYQAVRDLYRSPDVTEDYQLEWSPPDEEGLCDFLCRERAFSEDRVRKAVALMNSRGVGEGRPA